LARIYGPDFEPAFPVLIVLAISQLIAAVVGMLLGYLFTMTSHQQIATKIIGATAVLNVIPRAHPHVLDGDDRHGNGDGHLDVGAQCGTVHRRASSAGRYAACCDVGRSGDVTSRHVHSARVMTMWQVSAR
jgi:hypothetical protein